MNRAFRAIGWIGVVLLLTVAAAWLLSWRSPPFYRLAGGSGELPAAILTDAEYDAVHASFARPYVVRCDQPPAALVLFGANHTRDPREPELALMRQLWDELDPDIALVEGRPGAFLAAVRDPVATMGEGGAVVELGRRDDVEVFSWEPTREDEVALQLARFPAERVALFYVLRPYLGGLRHGKPDDPEGFVEEYRRKRTRWPGLEGTLASVDAIDAIWQRDFAGLPDWRDTSDEYGWPGYLNELFSYSNQARDEHFARVLLELLAQGHRIFAIAGSSHAVRLEPVVRAACG